MQQKMITQNPNADTQCNIGVCNTLMREPLIPLCINDIKNNQEQLMNNLVELRERLGSVLTPSPEKPESPNVKEPTLAEADMVISLKEVNKQIHFMNGYLREIISSLEV